ncbi:unnamed protein product [Toxocara canis]|uniref:Secreted protein n=1 Tax=Toxocara canis TaxID=6265 RepID=A0A183V140_TOXCA|nr:unnamed protein product [Toxocara canis]
MAVAAAVAILTGTVPPTASLSADHVDQTGRQQSTDVPMASMYFMPGLNLGSSDSADSHQLERVHRSRLKRNNTKQLTRLREPSMTDGDLFDQRQTTIPAVTTINTTTMADHDKLLTFEQSHTDVGPELNLVEDVVEQRRTLSVCFYCLIENV